MTERAGERIGGIMEKNHLWDIYTSILLEELQPAMGCTEPIAIAYAGAVLRDLLGEMPCRIRIRLSGNIIKNVKSVIVPATGGMHGIEAAVAAGVISGRYEKKLELLSVLTAEDRARIVELMDTCEMTTRNRHRICPSTAQRPDAERHPYLGSRHCR